MLHGPAYLVLAHIYPSRWRVFPDPADPGLSDTLRVLQAEWEREAREGFHHASRTLLQSLLENGSIYLDEGLFENLYPELQRILVRERGWWNPLVSAYAIYHFYRQAVLVLGPISSPREFRSLYGIGPDALVKLVEEGRAVVLLSAPHYKYQCKCLEDILRAQGALPTVLRLTETMKAVLTALHQAMHGESSGEAVPPLYDTRSLKTLLQSKLGGALDVEDAATRLSDLAVMGYRSLAAELVEALLEGGGGGVAKLVQAVHHVLVEPLVDSGATIGVYSQEDIEFISRAVQGSPGTRAGRVGEAVRATLWSLGAEAKLRVPRRAGLDAILGLDRYNAVEEARKSVAEYRRVLRTIGEKGPEAVREAKEIARSIAGEVARAGEKTAAGVSRKARIAMGLLSQVPSIVTSILLTSSGVEALLVEAASAAVSLLLDERVREALEKLLSVEETVRVVPVMPMLFEALSP